MNKKDRFIKKKLAPMFRAINAHAKKLGVSIVAGDELWHYNGIADMYGRCRVAGRTKGGQIVILGSAHFSQYKNCATYTKSTITKESVERIDQSGKSALEWH